MLQAHPSVLSDLLGRHAKLHAKTRTGTADPALRRQLDDVTYTLCVITGTRSLDQALAVARRRAGGSSRRAAQSSTATPSSSTSAESSHRRTAPTTAIAG
ncbi:DUF5133 domain-containing protein [Streptomyces sp. NPDC029674]|uniref:DUF5133 domain-containing protein n=1 Tax=Streptomyces sp. NPDC029674 TaxID=3365297 RepID=UPI00384C57ED